MKWLYDETKDSMSKGKIRKAILKSSNQFDFGFPIKEYQRTILTLQEYPKYGKDATLSSKFICGVRRCKGLVRFDMGKALAYHADEPQDYSFNVIYKQPLQFCVKLKESEENIC